MCTAKIVDCGMQIALFRGIPNSILLSGFYSEFHLDET